MNPIQLYSTIPKLIYDPSYEEVIPQEEAVAKEIVALGWTLNMEMKGFMVEMFAWKTDDHSVLETVRSRKVTTNFIADLEEKPNVILHGLQLILEEITTGGSRILGPGASPLSSIIQ
jgi:hypothetical protein